MKSRSDGDDGDFKRMGWWTAEDNQGMIEDLGGRSEEKVERGGGGGAVLGSGKWGGGAKGRGVGVGGDKGGSKEAERRVTPGIHVPYLRGNKYSEVKSKNTDAERSSRGACSVGGGWLIGKGKKGPRPTRGGIAGKRGGRKQRCKNKQVRTKHMAKTCLIGQWGGRWEIQKITEEKKAKVKKRGGRETRSQCENDKRKKLAASIQNTEMV